MSLLPNKTEQSLLADQVEEALNLLGIPAGLFLPQEMSMYKDRIEVDEGHTVQILLDENPTKRLLSNLGWYNSEEKPTLVYLAYTTNGVVRQVTQNSVVVMQDRVSLRVEEVNRNYLFGVWYILKCVPWERDSRAASEERVGSKTVFLASPREEAL